MDRSRRGRIICQCPCTECEEHGRHPVGHCHRIREEAVVRRKSEPKRKPRRPPKHQKWCLCTCDACRHQNSLTNRHLVRSCRCSNPTSLVKRHLGRLETTSVTTDRDTMILVQMDGLELAVLNIEWLAAIEKA